MLILFCACLAAVAYVYFGYPLLLKIGFFGRRVALVRGGGQPSLSIIVAAHNEESTIEAKLKCLLESDYPRERVEILIGSDGSSDKTEEIVRPYADAGVGLVSFPRQQGKSAMQNSLAAVASGEILVFTDADSLFPPYALPYIVENFADPRVGLVTAYARYCNGDETSIARNETLYLRYDTWLRERESERGILAMASGSLFAMRRSHWRPIDPALGDDFVLPLEVASAGLRNVIDTRVAAVTRLAQDARVAMLRMKARIISKDLRALLAYRGLLNPLKHGALALGLLSHKLLRWLVPYFLLAILASNCWLLDRHFFRVVLGLQAAFYALALVGFLDRNFALRPPWSIPMSFCLVNLAALLGTLKCFAGRTSGQWTPDRRASATIGNVPETAGASRGPK
jgi:cellulose synthase/poly-beta-1,6-N-acetylglucosamine synthase-like glycosyltransferase